jgi:hypothetical protein
MSQICHTFLRMVGALRIEHDRLGYNTLAASMLLARDRLHAIPYRVPYAISSVGS